jgi:hypothetical protein
MTCLDIVDYLNVPRSGAPNCGLLWNSTSACNSEMGDMHVPSWYKT